MSSFPHQLSPSTWRVLGFSVAAGYTFLGGFVLLSPVNAAKILGVWPVGASLDSEETTTTTNTTATTTRDLMLLLGARDFSIAAALWIFGYQRKERSMGTLILSGMILCAVDTALVFRTRGAVVGFTMGLGAAFWGVVGLGLL